MNDYCIKNYVSNINPKHHNDITYKDEGQKEVYLYAKKFMINNNLKKIIDVGCGSGYKLATYLNEFDTIGIETEPCYSYIKNTYPHLKWYKSGEEEKSFIIYDELKEPDVIICCDVIEHIVNPDVLLDYLISFNAKYYIISTPCRYVLCNHPKFKEYYQHSFNGIPINECHVREWTMDEFKEYLSIKFDIIESNYCDNQIECQYHLLKIK